jgi:hypothetical protein
VYRTTVVTSGWSHFPSGSSVGRSLLWQALIMRL